MSGEIATWSAPAGETSLSKMTSCRTGRIDCLPGLFLGMFMICNFCSSVQAGEARRQTNEDSVTITPKALAAVLSAGKWKQLEGSVDRALAWLASREEADW